MQTILTMPSFHEDSFQKTMTASIKRIYFDEKYGTGIIVDKTIFYPHGGGQKGDRGFFSFGKEIQKKIEILDTRAANGNILHICKPSKILISDIREGNDLEVTLSLNWAFRLKQMRLHAIAHLLHFFTEKALNTKLPYPDVSDLQDGYGINKYKIPNMINEQHQENITQMLTQCVQSGLKIETYPKQNQPNIRYWQCQEYIVPCGGTHLKNTAQIGDFSLSVSSKKGNTTLKFELR